MKKIQVEPREKSELAKELIKEIDQEIGSFSKIITYHAPIEDPAEEYWKDVEDSLIIPANRAYRSMDQIFQSNFENQMQALVHNATKRGPQNEDNSFAIYLGNSGYVISYNDGSNFFRNMENKSEWESQFFNYFSANQRWQKCYKTLGKKLFDEGPASDFSVETETGTLYIMEDKRNQKD